MKSESNPIWVVVASFGAGFLLCLVGAAAVFAFYEPDHEEEILVALEESVDAVMAERTPAVVEAVGDEASCEETLAMMRQAHAEAIEEFGANEELVEHLIDLVERSGATSPDGTPMDFPEQLDEQFRPENFEQNVEELMAECPELFPPGTTFDCDEYPCIIEAPAEDLPEPDRAFYEGVRDSCPGLHSVLGERTYSFLPLSVEDRHSILFMVQGRGIGLIDHINENIGNYQRRLSYRFTARHREVRGELYLEACVIDGDGEACRQMAGVYWHDADERMSYYQMGCDGNDAASCHAFGHTRCISMGNCDALARNFVERAIGLDGEVGTYYGTLGTILCQMGHSGAAGAAWRSGCELEDEESCRRSC